MARKQKNNQGKSKRRSARSRRKSFRRQSNRQPATIEIPPDSINQSLRWVRTIWAGTVMVAVVVIFSQQLIAMDAAAAVGTDAQIFAFACGLVGILIIVPYARLLDDLWLADPATNARARERRRMSWQHAMEPVWRFLKGPHFLK